MAKVYANHFYENDYLVPNFISKVYTGKLNITPITYYSHYTNYKYMKFKNVFFQMILILNEKFNISCKFTSDDVQSFKDICESGGIGSILCLCICWAHLGNLGANVPLF